MKATLEFNLPEEQYEHEYAVHGVDALLLISDLEGELRAMVNDDCGEFKKWQNEDGEECKGDYETLHRVWDFIIREKDRRRLPELI
jgi:hypothetical protein